MRSSQTKDVDNCQDATIKSSAKSWFLYVEIGRYLFETAETIRVVSFCMKAAVKRCSLLNILALLTSISSGIRSRTDSSSSDVRRVSPRTSKCSSPNWVPFANFWKWDHLGISLWSTENKWQSYLNCFVRRVDVKKWLTRHFMQAKAIDFLLIRGTYAQKWLAWTNFLHTALHVLFVIISMSSALKMKYNKWDIFVSFV